MRLCKCSVDWLLITIITLEMSENLSYLCRLCLKTSEFKFSLFTGNIVHKIQSLASIKIEEEDKLPTTCCESCVANVYASYKFQQCIINSDKKLREKMCRNELHIIELAKQTPNLFEVLHSEDTCDSPYTDIIEQLEPKSENEDSGECYYNESDYKVGQTEDLSQHNDDSPSKFFFQNVSQSRSSEGDNSNSEELYGESNLDQIKGSSNHSLNDAVNNIDVIKEDKCFAVNTTQLKDARHDLDSYKKEYNSCKEKDDDNGADKSNSSEEQEDIFVKLGIESKFEQKLAKYREKQKNMTDTLECTDCDKKFDSKRLLQRHMLKHKIMKCLYCSITMRSDNLKRHMKIHTDSPEVCEICGKIAKNKESLRGHLNYHHKNLEKIKCETCNKEFKSNQHYTNHVKKVHLGIKNHQCHICGKKFFASHQLNKHINMTHIGARPYVCQFCKKGFSSPYARKTHIRQHTLETPYRCDFCSTGFRQKISLVTHLKSKHATEDIKDEDKPENNN